MKATDTLTKIKNLLGMELSKEKNVEELDVTSEEVKLAQATLENGTVIEAESFEIGAEVFIVSEEDRVPMPVGEYTLEDGRIVKVEEEGIIASIGEAEAPAEETEVEASESNETETELQKHEYASREEVESLKSMVEEMKTKLEEIEGKQKEELSELETKLAETPATAPLRHSPESQVKKAEVSFSSSRRETSLDRIMQKLNNN